MRCLESIIRVNEIAACSCPAQPEVYTDIAINHDGGGRVEIRGMKGSLPFLACVDCSNPLDDAELVAFWRDWDGPRYVANTVEYLASQHRRIASAEANGTGAHPPVLA